MKKIKNFSLIFIFFLIQNNMCFATDGTYTIEKTGGASKFLFLLIGIALVSLVLFIGYKMDKMEANEVRKRKYKKEDKKDIVEEPIPKKEEFKAEIINEEKEEVEENPIKEPAENQEPQEDNNLDDELMEQLLKEEFLNNNEEKEEVKPETTKLDDIAKIFSGSQTNVSENDFNIGIKGYDFEEDDLDDIEGAIKEANIKRYTRKRKPENNKKKEKEEVKDKKKPKRYTRKIKAEEVVEKVEEENNIEDLDIIDEIDNLDALAYKFLDNSEFDDEKQKETETEEEKPKTKRGRKPKAETQIANEDIDIGVLPKSGRGRKPKAKPEGAAAKKTATKKTKKKPETKKRGRKPKVLSEEEELRNVIEMLPKSRRGRKPKSE